MNEPVAATKDAILAGLGVDMQHPSPVDLAKAGILHLLGARWMRSKLQTGADEIMLSGKLIRRILSHKIEASRLDHALPFGESLIENPYHLTPLSEPDIKQAMKKTADPAIVAAIGHVEAALTQLKEAHCISEFSITAQNHHNATGYGITDYGLQLTPYSQAIRQTPKILRENLQTIQDNPKAVRPTLQTILNNGSVELNGQAAANNAVSR